jgi:hypothetical protein
MKKNVITIMLVAILGMVAMQSCEKEKNEKNETKSSKSGAMESHNMGQNCMNCHKSGGEGEGWFNAAGTVYNEAGTATLESGTVQLHTAANGTGDLSGTVIVDGKGNFYTTESIDFSGGLYPSVQGSTATQHMSTTISNGQCNSCHGLSTAKLWTK